MERDIVERLRDCLEKRELPRWSDLADAIDEIESLRRQFLEGVSKALDGVKRNNDIIKDATERLDRAGIPR